MQGPATSFDARRRAIGAALVFNTLVCAGELVVGYQANSLSLLADAVHNGSDELALGCLYVAAVRGRAAAAWEWIANFLNSFGILVVAASIGWFALQRLLDPQPVAGGLTLAAGLAAAAGNFLVAASLRRCAGSSRAIRLAWLHNIGDVCLCLSTAASGLVILATGQHWVDALIGGGVAGFLVLACARELARAPLARAGAESAPPAR